MYRPALLIVTPLEDRTVPAGFGTAWVGTNLTVSSVPHGPDVTGAPSALVHPLAARTPAVGDIRISARPLSGHVPALTTPPDRIGPSAGELLLNTNKPFGTGDLRGVLLPEVGRALGLDHSPDPHAVLFGNSNSTALTGGAGFTVVALNEQTVIAVATGDATPLGPRIDARFLMRSAGVGPALADGYTVPPAAPVTAAPVAPPPATAVSRYFFDAPASIGTGFLAPTDPYSSPWW